LIDDLKAGRAGSASARMRKLQPMPASIARAWSNPSPGILFTP
jgi:hypothetical protein